MDNAGRKRPVASKLKRTASLACFEGGRAGVEEVGKGSRDLWKQCQKVMSMTTFKHWTWAQTHTRRYPLLRRGESEGRGSKKGEGVEGMSVVVAFKRASTAGGRGGLLPKRSPLLSIWDTGSRQSPVGVQTPGFPGSLIADLRPPNIIPPDSARSTNNVVHNSIPTFPSTHLGFVSSRRPPRSRGTVPRE